MNSHGEDVEEKLKKKVMKYCEKKFIQVNRNLCFKNL